ncbi:alpha/beta hydrolase [Actinomadura fulvescens]|uniref:Alpha/beta hydrolase fold domain-containing protein n=1 Tax=Actinomadura fulvescens TaxID=46160 RepID=A0ABN3R0C7_9ACTN
MIDRVDAAQLTSRRARRTAEFMHRRLRPRMTGERGIDERAIHRLANLERLAALAPVPRGVRLRRAQFDGFRGEWVTAPRVRTDGRAVLYFHGGGFICCGLATHRRLVAQISAAARMPVLSVAYRQLPDVPVSGSIADCVTAYRLLLARGHAPEDVVIAGDSAGGFLAFAATLRAVEHGLPKPAAVVGLSPWLDLECTAKIAHVNASLDPFIVADELAKLAALAVEGAVPPDPALSPLTSDLSLLPPALIQCGSIEVLRCDAERMAEAMERAGVPCRLQIWEGQIHVFQAFSALIPEARPAIAQVGAFIQEMTSSQVGRPAEPRRPA